MAGASPTGVLSGFDLVRKERNGRLRAELLDIEDSAWRQLQAELKSK
jgi:hypothetical protein